MHKKLRALLNRWRLITFTELLFIDLTLFSILNYFESSELLMSYIILSASLIYLIQTRFFKRNISDILEHLNHSQNDLEYSAKLFLKKEEELNRLEQLQREKITKVIAESTHFSLKNKLYRILCFAVISSLVWQIPKFSNDEIQLKSTQKVDQPFVEKATLSILSSTIRVKPHSYLKKKSSTLSSMSFSVHKYSSLTWEIELSEDIKSAEVIFTNSSNLAFSKRDGTSYQSKNLFLKQSDYFRYCIIGMNNDTLISDYGKITIIDDQLPKIDLDLKEQYINLRLDEAKSIAFKTTFSDDIGLRDARLVATVSRGKGESIKFREEELPFDIRSHNMKRQSHDVELIFSKFQMLPGDELYFYILATDNNPFEPGVQKSETFYIALEDTAEDISIAASAIGVNQMPAYFRSQRQIIIDTEKLISKRSTISHQDFLDEGNEIGYDQKILRLKYGQFLGEEFESDDVDPRAKSEELDIHYEDDGHDHDDIAQANLKQNLEDILEPYVHAHDLEAQSNFFDPRLKAKMRKVLREMWGSELYLRIGEPKKALAYQYRALKLLKEIKYESRIYVQRIGFEAPELNVDENRLTKLEDVPDSKRNAKQNSPDSYEAFSDLMRWLEHEQDSKYIRLDYLDEILSVFSQDLIDSRVNRLKDLNSLRHIRNHEPLTEKSRLALRNSLYHYLESKSNSLINPNESKKDLDLLYKKSLGRQLNE